MKKQEEQKPLRIKEIKVETARPVGRPSKKGTVLCLYNEGVICGLWHFEPRRCKRCGWNPGKRKQQEVPD